MNSFNVNIVFINCFEKTMVCIDLNKLTLEPVKQITDSEILKTDLELVNMVKVIEKVAKRSITNRQLRQEYQQNVQEMSKQLHEQLLREPHKAREIALAAVSLRNSFMDSTRSKLGEHELKFSEHLKKDGLTLDQLIDKELGKNFNNKRFSQLTNEEQLKFYTNVVNSSGRTSSNVDNLVKWCGRTGRFVLILTLLAVNYTNPLGNDEFISTLIHSLGATIGWALGYSATVIKNKRVAPLQKLGIFECKRKHLIKKNRKVSLRVESGMIFCYRLDKLNLPKKLYFSQFLDKHVICSIQTDNNKEYLTIGIKEQKLNVFWLTAVDGSKNQDWLEFIMKQQKWFSENMNINISHLQVFANSYRQTSQQYDSNPNLYGYQIPLNHAHRLPPNSKQSCRTFPIFYLQD